MIQVQLKKEEEEHKESLAKASLRVVVHFFLTKSFKMYSFYFLAPYVSAVLSLTVENYFL